MEPKFQSSFIPKGPVAASGNPTPRQSGTRSILSLLAMLIFTVTVVLAAGVFGYNFYLSSRITQVGSELDSARAQIDSNAVRELIRLDDRINSTDRLLKNHTIATPIFTFLEEATVRSVRFTDFNFDTSDTGPVLKMSGQATSYAAVALQAQAFSESQYFVDPSFSDLGLDDEGNVTFTFFAGIDPELLSYERIISREAVFSAPVSEPEPVLETVSATTTEETL